MQKLVSFLFSVLILALLMPLAVMGFTEVSKVVGLRPVAVPVIGTGSMYPSLFWVVGEGGPDDESKIPTEEYRTTPLMYNRFAGVQLFGRKFFYRPINRGDLVSFRSEQTSAILREEGKDPNSGFIKRVIGIPGDQVELRDGFVILNGQEIPEPYLYRPRSTFGDSFLSDCQVLTIPPGKYFVLGDNRKLSSDSRGELGLIDDQDISHVLPLEEQQIYHSLWRDPSRDHELSGTPSLDVAEFYTLLNVERQNHALPTLKPVPALTTSSRLRARESLLGNEDYNLTYALRDAGYKNVIQGEFLSYGAFSATELLQNLLYFSSTADIVLNPDYSDIGVVSLNMEVDGCPTELIVGHLGGYLPASYDDRTIESWRQLVQNLEEVIPSWEAMRAYDIVNTDKLNELLSILTTRLALGREIVGAMEKSAWLTDNQQARIDNDPSQAARAEQLINEINQEIRNR